MNKALARHKEGKVHVIPIILRHVDWNHAPFAHLQALPSRGDPVVGGSWHNKDEAFADIARNIRQIVDDGAIAYDIAVAPNADAAGQNAVLPIWRETQANFAFFL